MPTKSFYAATMLGLLAVMAVAVCALPQSVEPNPPERPSSSRQHETPQSSYVLKVTTRLVTLDLIATDSHGKPVRDLKPEDLQVFEEHNARQNITQFEFIDNGTANEPLKDFSSSGNGPDRIYSNQIAFEQLKIPPTVLLMDGVNTQTANQLQGRIHLLQLLKTLPPNTPIAVFLLGSSLQVLQGFTSDEALLRAAVDRVLTGNNIDQDPADDPNSVSNTLIDMGSGQQSGQIQVLQDFEKEQYANTIDLRVRQTLYAFTSIGQYLSGIPGRKNLIWVSESFPFSIAPNSDTGMNAFAGTRNYSDQVTAVANVLIDAQVAVYPVDVLGLATQQAFSASQPNRRSMTGRQATSQLNREQNARYQSQGTMDELAKDTGGKTCKNTNDLSGCVVTALNDSSSYYELGFYPQNVNWDGKFHKIEVKTSRPDVKLTYRRGYFAVDAPALAKQQQPEDRLRQGCTDLLPSTAIHLTTQRVPPSQALVSQGLLQYVLRISASGLAFVQTGESHSLNLQLAVCEFGGNNEKFRFYRRDLTKTAPEEVFRGWQTNGILDYIALSPSSDTRRLRFVLLDGATGLTGAIDIPVLPAEIAKAAEAASAPVRPMTVPFLEIPDREQTPSPPKAMDSLAFRSKTGVLGSLVWNSDTLLYRGDLTVDQIAPAFFSYAFEAKFHCQSGSLQPIDPASGEPTLRVTFHNRDGKVVAVDLKGEQPEYLGDLPVDPSAKPLFEQVWKLCHCQAP